MPEKVRLTQIKMDNNLELPQSLTDDQKKVIVGVTLITRIKNAIELLLTQTIDSPTRKDLLSDIDTLVGKYSAKFSTEKQNDMKTALDKLDKNIILAFLKDMVNRKVAGEDVQAFVSKLES